MSDDIYERGIRAAEEAVETLTRRSVAKSLDPLKPNDFVIILDRLTRRLEGVTKKDEAAAMSDALDALDVRWSSLDSEGVDKVIGAANQVLRKRVESIPQKVEAALTIEGPKLAGSTRASAKKTFNLEIGSALEQRDIRVERAVRSMTTNFVRDEMGRRVDAISEKARNLVARGLSRGYGSKQIGETLQIGLGDQVVRSPAYWRTIAGSFAGTARTVVQVGAFEDAGIESYMFSAVLDEVTTAVCRHYHGKIFSTEAASAHIERLANLTDPEEVVAASPWVQEGKDKQGNRFLYVAQGDRNVRIADIVRSGVGISDDVGEFAKPKSNAALTRMGIIYPPLHGHCRSSIVPV